MPESPESPNGPWAMHVIDDTATGADGVKLLDVNGDGRVDLTVPWETASEVRVYLNPGPRAVSAPWPRVTVGRVKGPEDAVLADIAGDGFADVVSATEGSDVTGGNGVYVHWAPASRSAYADAARWTTGRIRATEGDDWIQAAVLQIDGRHGLDVVVGALGGTTRVALLIAPEDPWDLDGWRRHEIHRGGRKVMSLEPHDFDGDGDLDLWLTLDVRESTEHGVGWLENPGPGPDETRAWQLRPLGRPGESGAFAVAGDLDGDGITDVGVPQGDRVRWYRGLDRNGATWEAHDIALPRDGGSGKGAAIADVNGDGRNDLVVTRTWNPPAVLLAKLWGTERWGVVWYENRGSAARPRWQIHDVSGPVGIKFDRIAMSDLDGDGDLDAVTTEEKVDDERGLGVIWYENPGA